VFNDDEDYNYAEPIFGELDDDSLSDLFGYTVDNLAEAHELMLDLERKPTNE
jgi:hypothetical protein